MSNNVIKFKRNQHKDEVADALRDIANDPPDRVAVLVMPDEEDNPEQQAMVMSTFQPGKEEIIAVDSLLETLTGMYYQVDVEE